ncbi:MAG: amino acid adenylation domain-containing protein [Candidatus Sulfotelmatobacter sp.]
MPEQLACDGYANGLQRPGEPRIPRRPQGAAPLLSFTQQQVWLHEQLAADVPLYHELLILERTGPLDRVALERSVNEILRRHEILRTTFPSVDGSVVPAVGEHRWAELPLTELNTLPERQRAAELLRIATEEVREPFDLANGPLMRIRLLGLSKENYVLVVTLHNLIADEWSLNILARELDALYQAYSTGQPSPLSELPVQYADCVDWHRNWFAGDVLDRHVSYWRERLAGIPAVLELPTDRPRPPVQGFRGARESFVLSKSLSESLKELSEREGATPFETLLAAFQTLLSRYTGQTDIVVGAIVPGREGVGADRLIGLFAHTVLIRTDVESDPTFRELLRRVRDLSRRDREHESMPFDRLVSELQPEREPSRNPLFQVLFSLTSPTSAAQLSWDSANLEVDSGATKVDLQLQLSERPEGISGSFTYNTEIFDAATIGRLAGHFQTLLQGVVTNPDQRLSRLPLLGEAERHQLLVEWNSKPTDYPSDRCVHQLFEAQVKRVPNAIAVVFENDSLTYSELNRRANQLAHYLAKLGVGPDVLVGILVERSLDMVVGLLGILKAGGAYVPLDPAYPRERVAFMLEDSEVPVLLTQRHLLGSIPDSRAKVVVLDSDWREIAKEEAGNPVNEVRAKNLAYVIYTSGSTGKPKGVQLPHRAVVNFLTSMSQKPGMTAEDRLLAVTTLCFDIAGLEIYLPLSVGASFEIVSREVSSDGSRLLAKLAKSNPTMMQATPATWRMLLEAGWQGNPRLKILCGGEAISRKLADQLLQRVGSLWNMYGPTETTIWSTTAKIEPGQNAISIGQPIANTQLFILDKVLQPVPIGVAGELHIGGDGLARGYLHRPELTAEKFIPDPFSPDPEARLYKTGDLVRYLPNGDIEFLGRIDHQIKVRGFRIEMGEIEAVLRQHGAVNETVVVVREDTPGNQRLVAYVVPAHESASIASELREFLKAKLPEYMVPSAFVPLKAMPLTPNGKVNRRALPAPDQTDLAPTAKFAAPKDVIESRLVQIWEAVLGVRPIGVRHNFFELGGHSLVAVKLMNRVEQAFRKTLPIATLLQAPTIEQLAAILRQEGWEPSSSCLVPIQTGGSRTPFFCIHGANGAVVRFYDLARYLGSDQPFYGLQALGLDERFPSDTQIEVMASRYINEIRSVQPEGPYLLGGYSMGGSVAFEMARQLTAQGQERAVVVLFDTLCAAPEGTEVSPEVASTSSALAELFRVPAREKLTYLWRIATAPIRSIDRWTHVARLPRIVKRVRKACLQAEKDYKRRPYAGRVILFRSSHRPLGQVSDPRAGWSTYARPGLEICDIKGNHENILLEPQVRSVAEQLRNCLEEEASRISGQLLNV